MSVWATRRAIWIAVGVVVLGCLGIAVIGAPMGWGMGPAMMGGYGPRVAGVGVWAWMIPMALGWIVVVGLVALVAMGISRGRESREEGDRGSLDKDLLTILKRRYAAGEIDHDTYERMNRDLAA